MVGSRQDAHVAHPRLRLADPLVPLFLQHPEQLGLKRQRQVTDLVQEEGASLGDRHFAHRVLDRPGEGALGVAEQLALQQFGRQAGAINSDEGAGRARAAGVDGPRQDPFSRTALSPEQHSGLSGSHLEGQFQGLLHRRLFRLQDGLGHGQADLLFQLSHLGLQLAYLGDPVE